MTEADNYMIYTTVIQPSIEVVDDYRVMGGGEFYLFIWFI